MFDFVSYMRTVATQLKEIQHSEEKCAFHRVTNLASLEELLANGNFIEDYQMIVEDVMEGNFDTNGNTLIDNPTFRFYIVKQAANDDFDSKEECKRNCKVVAKKIISRLFHDNFEDKKFPAVPVGLANLQRESFQYFSIGPIMDNMWGVEVSFSLLEGAGISYDENDWII
jgi:hypothetical protein